MITNSRGFYTSKAERLNKKSRFPYEEPTSSSFIINQRGGLILWMMLLQCTGSKLKERNGGGLFTNTLGVIMAAAWRIECVTNLDENITLLYFVKPVVQSYLHVDRITAAPNTDFWKSKKLADDCTGLTGCSHWSAHIQKRVLPVPLVLQQRMNEMNECKECDVALSLRVIISNYTVLPKEQP